MVRILIADGSAVIRDALRCFLTKQGFDVVADALDGATAIERAQQLAPDVALIEYGLPGMGGVAVAQAISQSCPATYVIGFGLDEWCADAMLSAGAASFVAKGSDTAPLLDAIRENARAKLDSELLSASLQQA